ncbi:hypothetical protein [Croceicoccus mobilis]|uniref:Lipoprotein n=1 Tax=Croceicoccus mobilis TaxID=1703339 RepID=A0A916YXN1_9SPHN|nr:hypothetical protein [Croceicoccus mobilis]GGD65839.1 hypothetical protein GCM10010990_14160 [Croceicoccus mobilis]
MKKILVIAGAAMLSACGSPEAEQAEAPVTETEAPVEVMPLLDTSWSFAMDGTDYFESIDAEGNYLTNVMTDDGEEHFDHGLYEMIDGKHCFTSQMNEDGQMCWTTPAEIATGDTVDAVSDSGDTLAITRQEYRKLEH